jgi:uncharacterized protein YbaA (DUF1428 family)
VGKLHDSSNRVNARVIKDQRIMKMMERGPVPFDVKRMVYTGFKMLVDD